MSIFFVILAPNQYKNNENLRLQASNKNVANKPNAFNLCAIFLVKHLQIKDRNSLCQWIHEQITRTLPFKFVNSFGSSII